MPYKNKFLYILTFLSSIVYAEHSNLKNAITPKDIGERLGDRLLMICAVKYIALTHNNLDFYYNPTALLDQFTLSVTNKQFTEKVKKKYNTIATFNEASFNNTKGPTLFLAPWSVIDTFSQNFSKRHVQKEVFCQLQEMLTPLNATPTLEIPAGYVSVAVHIRKGDGYDRPLKSIQIYKNLTNTTHNTTYIKNSNEYSDVTWPYKFPPEQFYIDQINMLSELLAHKKVICYIFSDSRDPEELTNRISYYCTKENLQFINASSSCHDSPIIDMCKIASCECLIRGQSAYSMVAQIMGNHKVVISPKSCVWHKDILSISQTSYLLCDNIRNDSMECILEKCNFQVLKTCLDELFP